MKLLLLNGHGIDMRVDGAKLRIKDGRFSVEEEPKEYVFSPKRIDVDHIIFYGQDGNISIDAIRWLVKHNVAVTILNWNGKLLTSMFPPESVQVKIKFAQYHAFEDKKMRLNIAKMFIKAKTERSKFLLEWLKERYSSVSYDFSLEEQRLKKAETIAEVIQAEARIAAQYWRQIVRIIPEKYEFVGRNTVDRPFGAGDMLNSMLNYGYALLEAECLRAINGVGLDVHVGFLHEMAGGKNSLAYDLQEPFRFIIDLAVISLIENKVLDKKDFIRTENYNLRFRATGARKVTEEINKQFNKKVEYQGKQCSWNYILHLKTRELAHFLLKKKEKLNFEKPVVNLDRVDSEELREQIISFPYVKWKKLGFSKGTLHYMKQNAQSDKPFTLNKHVKERLEELKVGIK